MQKPHSLGTNSNAGVSRYFFNITNGEAAPYPQCLDLSSIREVRREASKMACRAITDNPDAIWKTGEWQLTVTDDRGLNLFSLLILAIDAPVSRGR